MIRLFKFILILIGCFSSLSFTQDKNLLPGTLLQKMIETNAKNKTLSFDVFISERIKGKIIDKTAFVCYIYLFCNDKRLEETNEKKAVL